jgi:hypothetical protein
MSLLLVYLALLIITQSATIATALAVEGFLTPATGLLVFIGLYFTMFWLTWVIAVWLTEPGKRLGAYLSKAPPVAVKGA